MNKKRNITNTDKQHRGRGQQQQHQQQQRQQHHRPTTTTQGRCRYALMLSERAELWLPVTRYTPWGPSADLALILSRMAPLPGIC